MNQTELAHRIVDDTGLFNALVEQVLAGLDRALVDAARTQTAIAWADCSPSTSPTGPSAPAATRRREKQRRFPPNTQARLKGAARRPA